MSESLPHPVLPWSSARDVLERLGFYLLVAAALFGIPIISIGDDAITVFDAALVVYSLARLLRGGVVLGHNDWRPFFALWALYGMYLLLRFLPHASVFAGLLVAKQFEHLIFALLLVDRLDNHRSTGDLKATVVLISAAVAYQILYYHNLIGGIGANYRLGLPFATGVSSNPAGFFLGAWVVVLLHTRRIWREFPAYGAASLLLSVYALIQTRSRTNLLALLLVLVVTVCIRVWRAGGWRWVAAALVGFALAYASVVLFVEEAGPLARVIRLLKDPLSALEDGSFAIRLRESWPRAFGFWRADWRSVLIGRGLDYTGPVDGTVPRLLANQGVIGLLLFLSVWYVHFLVHRKSAAVLLLLLFAFLNGINAETLVISYRSIQAYMVILVIAVSYGSETWKTTH